MRSALVVGEIKIERGAGVEASCGVGSWSRQARSHTLDRRRGFAGWRRAMLTSVTMMAAQGSLVD
jgi:hypothetical protein